MTDAWVQIVKYGTFSIPACRRYWPAPPNSVFCNRCRTQDIPCCIGFDMYDLCLPCVHEIVTHAQQVRNETLQAGYESGIIERRSRTPPPPYPSTD